MARQANSIAPSTTGVTEHAKRVLDVTVILLEDGYASTAIGPIEVFHSAGLLWEWLHGAPSDNPPFRVRVASIDGNSVTSLCSLGLTPQCSIHDIEHTDIIVLPSSGWDVMDRIAKHSSLLPWLHKWYAKGAYIAGVCSGVAFLAECGLLDGREATTHWGVADAFRQRYPRVIWRPDRFVTEDSRLLCSGGIYASLDISLYLVEKFCGHEIALQFAKSLLISMPRSKQSGYSVLPLSHPHSDDKIRASEDYLQANLDRPISIDLLAERVGMGQRNFIRRFKAATGRVPGEYVQMLRVAAAKEMLEQGASSIQAVSTKIGYEDVAFFRSLFKRHTGLTPADYRARFAKMTFDRGELVSG